MIIRMMVKRRADKEKSHPLRRSPSTKRFDACLRFLFSFRGRLGRQPFWLGIVLVGGLTQIATMMVEEAEQTSSKYAFASVVVVGLWSCIALQVKRLHDINLSAWLLLANLIPVVGPLATFVLAGFRRGHPGPNRFGPDPTTEA